MAFTTVPSALLFSFLLISAASLIALSHIGYCQEEAEMSESHHFHLNNGHVISISSLLPTTDCSTSSSSEGMNSHSSLKILHRHNPCLQPSLVSDTEKTKSPQQLLKQILLQDQLRVDSIQHKLLSTQLDQTQNKKTSLPARSGRSLGTGNYIVRVGFGTPKTDLSLIFDTGSDFSWIQCDPCARYCYTQQEPIFNPSHSNSYSNITCNAKACSDQLRSATGVAPGCSSSTCIYGIQYGDQSFSVGFFASETITINTDVFHNFLFGCGQNNRGLFGTTAGLLGLGRDPLSFVSQTASTYGQSFSYCLPSKSTSTGLLTFGSVAFSSSVKFTPMLTNSKSPSFYFLDLTGISVAGRMLAVSASVFASSGTIIDSGTVITRLPSSAYEAFRSAFRKFMAKYPLGKPLSILDTCYNLTGYSTVTIPKIGLFFSPGIEVGVDPSGVVIAASVSQVCMAFAPNNGADDVTIYGNMQQQKLDVLYDLGKKRIGFGPGSCT